MRRAGILTALVAAGLVAAAAAAATAGEPAADLPDHPALLPPLTPDATFPRCTPAELAAAGYPDHRHAWTWPGWTPPVGEDGRPYGPGTICDPGGTLHPRPDLVITDDTQRLGPFALRHNPAYAACDIASFTEVLDLARRDVAALLDLAPADTLTILNPDNNSQYRELGAPGTWRLYLRRGDKALLQPIGTLQARTLDGHAAWQLAADWTLADALPAALPPWLHQGLVRYLAEDGVHLANYMVEFRGDAPVLYPLPILEAVLGGAPDADPARDRERWRRASYGAFLMAWELVENRGGLQALREFLHLVRDGATLDEASRRVYGLDMSELARSLDPVDLGEPVGSATEPRRPHRQP